MDAVFNILLPVFGDADLLHVVPDADLLAQFASQRLPQILLKDGDPVAVVGMSIAEEKIALIARDVGHRSWQFGLLLCANLKAKCGAERYLTSRHA